MKFLKDVRHLGSDKIVGCSPFGFLFLCRVPELRFLGCLGLVKILGVECRVQGLRF